MTRSLPTALLTLVAACAIVAYSGRADRTVVAPAVAVETATEGLQARIEGESLDTHLTVWAGDRVDDALRSGLGEDGRLTEAACGESLCRFAFDFDDRARLEQSLAALDETLPWGSDRHVSVSDDDPLRVVLFAAREGQPLF